MFVRVEKVKRGETVAAGLGRGRKHAMERRGLRTGQLLVYFDLYFVSAQEMQKGPLPPQAGMPGAPRMPPMMPHMGSGYPGQVRR